MADQLRWDCVSCYGDHPVQTPNLDTLAEEFAVFTRVYCGTPLCTPTRISMFTGKWPHTHGAIVNGHVHEPEKPYGTAGPSHKTDYEILSARGYLVTHVGVLHLRLDPPLEVAEPYYSMYPPENIEMPETVGRWCDGQPLSLLTQSCGHMGLGHLPLLVKPPGGASSVRRQLVNPVDYTPTICESAGLEPPDGPQEQSNCAIVENEFIGSIGEIPTFARSVEEKIGQLDAGDA